MSEPISGVELAAPVPQIRAAAAVILVRAGGSTGTTLFWVRRGRRVTFSGGYHAFPGGSVDAADAELPIAGCSDDERALRGCALRETFEEAGVLLAHGVERLAGSVVTALRHELLAGADFGELLARSRLTLRGDALVPAGRWLTPPFSAVRFDARFYLALVGDDAEASVIPGELSEGGWIRPADALELWETGAVLLHPPNHHVLGTLAGFPPDAAIERLRRPPYVDADRVTERIEFQRGVILYPLRTETLPPAQHTNAYVLGTGHMAIVDPGASDLAEIDRLERFVGRLAADGRTVKCVLLSHHHVDHVGGVAAIKARFGVPVLASAQAARRLDGLVDVELADGEVVELPGPMPMRWRAVLTEGHAPGHLVFWDERSQALIAGDMVAAGSTIVIDPPEGDLATYLESLERLKRLPTGTIYPAHGFAIRDGAAKLDEYIAHREGRLEQIASAVAAGEQVLETIVRVVYHDTPEGLHPLAARSALASLIELERRGLVERSGEVWQPC